MPDTAITLQFGDGEYRFWLPMPQLCALEKECDKSALTMFDEMSASVGLHSEDGDPQYVPFGHSPSRFMDIRSTIRFGLIGGNLAQVSGEEGPVSPIAARQIVEGYVDGRPISETLPVAWAILNAAINGVTLKKKADEPEADPSDSEKA